MKVIVIGGGPAGMMAAGIAAQQGAQVLLIEKNTHLGKKLSITGKGRCNLTNESDVQTHLENIPTNPYFLYSALYGFDSTATRAFFQSLGVPTQVERGRRVFPVSGRAMDVVHAMEQFLKKNRVQVHCHTTVRSIITENGRVTGVALENGQNLMADRVIVATGGLSYPTTGSTGDGFRFAKALGHTVTKTEPSLVPLRTKEDWCAQCMGLGLKNVKVQFYIGKKKIYEDFGEMLFTHFGVSGPVVLSASRHLCGHYEQGIWMEIDLKPALTEKELEQRILRDFSQKQNKQFVHSLDDLLPKKLIPVIVSLSEIDPEKRVNAITKQERSTLLRLLKHLTLHITGSIGFGQAVVTKGGVEVDEVNPSTMQSKKIAGLFFAGEVLDVDAYTGGYNLQIAFATGFAAGKAAGGKGE